MIRASTVTQLVKLLLTIPTSHTGVPAADPTLLTRLGKQQKTAQILGPLPPTGEKTDGVSGCWLQSGPDDCCAHLGREPVDEKTLSFALSLPLCHSTFK